MGYPGDGRPSPYGEPPADTPPGQYGEGGPYGPGAAGMPTAGDGYDPDATRIERAPQFGGGEQAPYSPYGNGPQPGYGSGQQPAYGTGPQAPYGSGPQSPYAPPRPSGPYGPPPGQGYPQTATPFGDPPGYGPSGPQPPQDPAWSAPPPGGGFGGPPPGPPYGPPPGKSGGKKTGLIIGGIVAAVVILGGGGTAVAFAVNSDDDPAPKPTRTGAQPTASSPAASATPTPTSTAPGSSRWQKIASRSTDPKPLTTAELFSRSRVSAHGRSYHQVIHGATTRCSATVTGSRIKAAETAGHCTQLLRATYLRGDRKVMGTVSISNLSTYAAAHRAFEAAAGGQQYVTPLRGKSGRTARLGRGAALGIRQVKGHYLILSWVQYADGHKPATASGRKQLSAFHSDVVSTTLARPLSYRMITGRPRS